VTIEKVKNSPLTHYALIAMILVYIVLNLVTLDKYRIVHDDEGVLASSALSLSQFGLSYFDPNLSFNGPYKGVAIFPLSGFLFLSTLSAIGHFLGYGLYQMRLQPLFFSVVSLILTYIVSLVLFEDKKKALLAVFFMGFSAKYIGLAHTVRQESMLITCILGIVLLFLLGRREKNPVFIYYAAFLSGASISIHANGVFLPLMLCFLLFGVYREFGKRFNRVFLGAFAFSILGSLIFIFFDYFPHREYYWQLFNSNLLNGVTNSINGSISIEVLRSRLYNIWMTFFWESRYHRYMFYFALYVLSVLGALFFRRRAHIVLFLMLAYILIVILLLHESQFYFIYTVPFFSLLLSSVLIEMQNRFEALSIKRTLVSVGIIGVMVSYILLLAGTLLAYRNYDYSRQIKLVKSVVGENDKFISSDSYFFGFNSNINRYSHYLLYNYDLKRLMREMRIGFFILDSSSNSFLDTGKGSDYENSKRNLSFLNNECVIKLNFQEYNISIRNPVYTGRMNTVYDCGKLVGL